MIERGVLTIRYSALLFEKACRKRVYRKMHIIVGLGNPGAEYARTRHNIGWLALDEVARRHEIRIEKKQGEARVGGGSIPNPDGGLSRVLLAKPQTFMNLSGRAVVSLMHFYRAPKDKVLVVTDDLNLPLGKLRLRPSGSDGGHNGLKSVAQLLGTTEYSRLRIGVGAPHEEERRERGTAGFVLRPFGADELSEVEDAIRRSADCIETFITHGVATAMNQFNG
jgi:PTH1 family peptidyl-tRNA hydrolase